jgi:hypothetical protein
MRGSGEVFVSEAVGGTVGADEAALHSVAEAMRDAAVTASEGAAKARQTENLAGPQALEAISHIVYTGSYVVAYGVVYAVVFVAHSLPQENPVMRGLRDGGRAAVAEACEI